MGDMSTHEAETHIKSIQKFVLLNILLGLSFSAHCHPKHTKIAQGYLHIFPPSSVVEGCKDSAKRAEESIFLYAEIVNSSRSYVGTCK